MRSLLFLHGSHIPECSARVDKYFQGYFTLQFMLKGNIKLRYDDKLFSLSGCWFWPAYPGPKIQFFPAHSGTYWNHRYIAVSGSLMQQWIAEGLYPKEPQPFTDAEEGAALMDQILAEFRQNTSWSNRRAVNLLENLLLQLAELRRTSQQRPRWLQDVLSALSHDFSSYRQIAVAAHQSLPTLRRRFRQVMGISLHAYVLRKRLTDAAELLMNDDLSIKEIAEQLGYRDVYFFSRQFQRQMGMPPGRFRHTRQSNR